MEVEHREQRVATVLYADDIVLFVVDEETLCLSMKTLQEWCEHWAVKVNVNKHGVLYKGKMKTVKEF